LQSKGIAEYGTRRRTQARQFVRRPAKPAPGLAERWRSMADDGKD